MIIVYPWFVLGWVLASWVIGMLGRNKRLGFFGNFLVSFLFSPLVGIIVLLASDGPMFVAGPGRPRPGASDK